MSKRECGTPAAGKLRGHARRLRVRDVDACNRRGGALAAVQHAQQQRLALHYQRQNHASLRCRHLRVIHSILSAPAATHLSQNLKLESLLRHSVKLCLALVFQQMVGRMQ